MTSLEAWAHLLEFINASLLVFTFIGFLYMIVYVMDFTKEAIKVKKKTGDMDEKD